ncbi:hypothetical protein B0H10DRAFT_2217551 [Mycena sp. CBHHK59/15]|nr:hypothetical protein B0H10DRAFT_2217551 [Mycena sp. CBHHK59/15]
MEMPGLRRVTRDQNKTTCSGVNAGVEKKTRGTREEQAKVREDAENKKAAGDAMIEGVKLGLQNTPLNVLKGSPFFIFAPLFVSRQKGCSVGAEFICFLR